MNFGGHDIGICSWSLKPVSVEALLATVKALHLSHIQLAFAPLLDMADDERDTSLKLIKDAGVTVTAGMIGFAGENYTTIASIKKSGGFVPSDLWPQRRERALQAGELAARMGVPMVTTHPGFVPPSGDPAYVGVVERITEIATAYAKNNVQLGLETGQEKATELLQFLNDLNMKNVVVNFDAANMLLYGAGSPIEAIATLGRHIRHVHIKDALASQQPGTEWGREVAFGYGDLNVHGLLRALRDAGYTGPLIIERESGPDQVADIEDAIETLRAHLEGEAGTAA